MSEMNMQKVIKILEKYCERLVDDATPIYCDIEMIAKVNEAVIFIKSIDKLNACIHDCVWLSMTQGCLAIGGCMREHKDKYTPKEASE